MTSTKVSVIMPVYNVAPYLRQSLDSVVNQTLKEIEIICIDDCSTDGSWEILQEYALKDNRIILLKQEFNQGTSIARNIGLDAAKGDYIAYIDSDDMFYSKNYLEALYNACEKYDADIAVASIIRGKFGMSAWQFLKIDKEIVTCDYYQKLSLCELPRVNHVWNKLYKRSSLLASRVSFIPQLTYEDMPYTCRVLYYLPKLVSVPGVKYFYRKRESSITNNKNHKIISDYKKAKSLLYNFLNEKGIDVSNLEEHVKKYKFLGLTYFKIHTRGHIRKNILLNCINWETNI